jgi:hypothetical protein
MNNPSEPVAPQFAWYQVGSWTTLEQGDLLPDCPALIPSADLSALLSGIAEGGEIEAGTEIQFADQIILSQSCDLANDKIGQVLLCAYHPASSYSKDNRTKIRKEQRPALHMIEASELPGHEFSQQVIDFRTIYTLPKEFVVAFARTKGSRVRLLPPYREHLSQAFARYFMRVGLPRPLTDE